MRFLGTALAMLPLVAASSPATATVQFSEAVQTADGVLLATRVYLPDESGGKWPTLLIRSPYPTQGNDLLVQGLGYRSDHPDFALPTRVSCVLEGEATRRFEPSNVVASPAFLSRVQTCPGSDRSRSSAFLPGRGVKQRSPRGKKVSRLPLPGGRTSGSSR